MRSQWGRGGSARMSETSAINGLLERGTRLMLVTNQNLQEVLQSYARTTQVQGERPESASPGRAAAASRRDAVQLSAGTVELQKALAVLQASPEVRQDLVNALRRDIQSGSFQVDVNQIASQLALVV
ncbi:MAG: flagellar biosynthesis anti-sigma factor FlgM [Armatimonadia bacterium]|nr:flagellar biosynthesis anti-sigma factor FlgM [Armatimonadia bacterium]